MSKPLVVIGGGGHAKVLIDSLILNQEKIIGIVDPKLYETTKHYLHIPVFSNERFIHQHHSSEIELVLGLGSLPKNIKRFEIYNCYKKLGFSFKTVIHPSALIGTNVLLGEGTHVMAGVIIQCHSIIGSNVIVNTKSSIDHDSRVGNNCHIAPGVTLSGNVILEENVHVGTGACIINNIIIEKNTVIGAGAVITKNIEKNCIVYPCKSKIQLRE